jgi:hypothetical protein
MVSSSEFHSPSQKTTRTKYRKSLLCTEHTNLEEFYILQIKEISARPWVGPVIPKKKKKKKKIFAAVTV